MRNKNNALKRIKRHKKKLNYNQGVFTVIWGCENERNREKEEFWASTRPGALLGSEESIKAL